MTKTTKQIENLRERVTVVRDNFRANPEIKWLPMFRNQHPQFTDHAFRNCYYKQSTNAEITVALEKHWAKYSQKISI
tara:strand:+ start:318 stop:548 length:231 start_codon:yes stop_codon:yes gene_type:complete